MDRHGIAARIRGLIGGQDRGDLANTAGRLGVPELSLRMSVDDVSPHPTIDVLAAIVRTYGVDPTWLLHGDYSAASHQEAAALDEEGSRDGITRLLHRLLDVDERPSAGRVFRYPSSSSDPGPLDN